MILIYPANAAPLSGNVDVSAMFDGYLNTQTENSDLIEVTVDASNRDRCMLFNLEATSVDLELTDNATGNVVLEKTLSIPPGQTGVTEGLYIFSDALLKISINYPGGTAKCGQCDVGLSTDIGDARFGYSIGVIDYSIVDTNTQGQTYLDPGAWAKELSVEMRIPREAIDNIYYSLVDARGRLVAVAGETDDETLDLFGFFTSWEIVMNSHNNNILKADMQGVI